MDLKNNGYYEKGLLDELLDSFWPHHRGDTVQGGAWREPCRVQQTDCRGCRGQLASVWRCVFAVRREGVREIRLLRVTKGAIDTLFIKRMDVPVKPPIGLSDDVIVINSDDGMWKLNIRGEVEFDKRTGWPDGRGALGGRLSESEIFMWKSIRPTIASGNSGCT